MQGRHADAIELADHALIHNVHNHKARVLKAALLRLTGKHAQAKAEAQFVHGLDALDFGALNELALLDENHRDDLVRALRGEPHNHIELALDYAAAGRYSDALEVLRRLRDSGYPMLGYLSGWIHHLDGDDEQARNQFQRAARQSPHLCFPNRLEEMLALQSARQMNPDDGMAAYYLGNLLYSKRVYDGAIEAWESARNLCPDFPTVHRNLALAYGNKRHDVAAAQEAMEKSFELDPTDARVLFELDQLYRKINYPPQKRLALLEKHDDLVLQRDDLYIERIHLLLLLEQFEKVQELLAARNFHPWEGGEGKVSGAHVASLIGIAQQHLQNREYGQALASLHNARTYPSNLGEGKLHVAQENHLDYFTGLALRGLNRDDEAKTHFQRATYGSAEPVSAMYYNDQPPDMIFYQGLALRELGRQDEAQSRFKRLVSYGQEHLKDAPTIDYFAVSLPEFLVFEDDLARRNRVHCNYMIGLGELGSSHFGEARSALQSILNEDASHLGATAHLQMLERIEKKRA